MAFPTTVNAQITEAVTQSNVKVPNEAPAMKMSDLFASTADGLAAAIRASRDGSLTAQGLREALVRQGMEDDHSAQALERMVAMVDHLAKGSD
jgi:Killing trait